jgi:flagellar biosynthesis/type III secretory pathway protein FliH
MAVRRRSKRKRRNGATSPSAPAPAPPLDLTTEIEQSIEARDKLESAAGRFAAERDQAKPAFLRSLAGELRAVEIDANRAQEKFAAFQAQEARAAQQSDALYQLSTMFKDRVEGFKSRSRDETVAALQRIVERLIAERDKSGADKDAINKRIEKLLGELNALFPTVPPAPPRDPKDKTPPPQRPAKGKPQPREGGKI